VTCEETNRVSEQVEAVPYRAAKDSAMKAQRPYADLGAVFDDIFEAAQNFQDEFHRNWGGAFGGPGTRPPYFDDNTDYYPTYSYPPMNVYMTDDRGLNFEFALAGFDEKDIALSFQGDYMVFSATLPTDAAELEENTRNAEEAPQPHYLKHRLKMKNIEKQKYYVPQDKYEQDQVKAVYKNGILRVMIPPRAEPEQNDGIKINIINDD
jgi:HSP20 family molecular chaperone IbpA